MAPALIAASVPDLAPEDADRLPARRPGLVRLGVAAVAAGATGALQFGLLPDGFGDRVDAARNILALAPWLLTLPWLKHLDLRPVVWFFLCLLCGIAAPVLVWKVVYRALSLPYRDWEIASWHAGRARAVRGLGAVVLVDPSGGPAIVRGTGEARWRATVRWAWSGVCAGFVALVAADLALGDRTVPDWPQDLWLLAVTVVAVGHLLGELVLDRRHRRRLADPHEHREPAQ